MRSDRSKATDIKNDVRERVKARDGWCCIFCREFGESGYEPTQIMHYIGRKRGGLGIEENLALGCVAHHQELDNGKDMDKYRSFFKEYLESIYPGWNERELIYSKWSAFAIN